MIVRGDYDCPNRTVYNRQRPNGCRVGNAHPTTPLVIYRFMSEEDEPCQNQWIFDTLPRAHFGFKFQGSYDMIITVCAGLIAAAKIPQ